MAVSKVLVIGAGIGGLGAASALTRRGIQVEIVEIRPNSDVVGVGINQPGNSLRALDALGLLEECLSVGYQYEGTEFLDWNDESIVYVPSQLGDDRVPANNALTRKDLHGILLKSVVAAGIPIRYSTTATNFTETAKGVVVEFSDGSRDTFDAVAAFDGVKSPTRRRIFGEDSDARYTGYAVWRVQIPRPADLTHLKVFQGDGTKAGLVPISQESMYLFLVTPEPENPYFDPANFGELLKDRLKGYSGIVGQIRDALAGPEGIVYSPLQEVSLSKPWNKGRVIVLGDAAHAAAPHLTQGAAMALEDAVVLADELAVDRPVPESLATVSDLRFERTKLVFDVSHAILESEMAITKERMVEAEHEIRQHMPERTAFFESKINEPFRSGERTVQPSA